MRRNAQCGLYQIVARQALSPLVYQPVAIVEPERFKDFTRTSHKCEIGSCYISLRLKVYKQTMGGLISCLEAELKCNYEHPNGHYFDVVSEASLHFCWEQIFATAQRPALGARCASIYHKEKSSLLLLTAAHSVSARGAK